MNQQVFIALMLNELLAMRPTLSSLYQLHHRNVQDALSNLHHQSDQDHNRLFIHFLTASILHTVTYSITRAQ
jgi:hypothetical protein